MISQKGALSSPRGKGRGWETSQNQAGAGIAWGREDGRARECRDFRPLKTRFTDRRFDGGAGTLEKKHAFSLIVSVLRKLVLGAWSSGFSVEFG